MVKIKHREIIETFTIVPLLIFVFVILLSGCKKKDYATLEQLAYDQARKNMVVYLKEEDTYIPYLVVTSNYQGNVLLLRQNLLEKTMPYKENKLVGWSSDQYGSYYEESSIDQFLNTQFLETLSETVKESIISSSIEVTYKESYFGDVRKVHTISRDVFLLSAQELDLKIEYTAAKEGIPLKYFKDEEYVKKIANLPDGSKCAYWTRTPDLFETYLVITVGPHACSSGTADICSGVRPAFCLSKMTKVKKRNDIVEGQTVYVIDM